MQTTLFRVTYYILVLFWVPVCMLSNMKKKQASAGRFKKQFQPDNCFLICFFIDGSKVNGLPRQLFHKIRLSKSVRKQVVCNMSLWLNEVIQYDGTLKLPYNFN